MAPDKGIRNGFAPSIAYRSVKCAVFSKPFQTPTLTFVVGFHGTDPLIIAPCNSTDLYFIGAFTVPPLGGVILSLYMPASTNMIVPYQKFNFSMRKDAFGGLFK